MQDNRPTVLEPVGGAACWRGPDYLGRTDWICRLSEHDRDEVREAHRRFVRAGKPLLETTARDFPLPTLGPKLRRFMREAEYGRGFVLYRGLPIDTLPEEDVRAIYWGIGLHLGIVVPQSAEAEFIGDVRDRGDSLESTRRGYRSRENLNFHTDAADVVMLLCRRKAMTGGQSLVASAAAIHDHLLATEPDLLATLYEPAPIKPIDPDSPHPYYHCPIFAVQDGFFHSKFQYRSYPIKFAFDDGTALRPGQAEAIERIHRLACDPAFHFPMAFENGDLQLLFNHLVYHGRSAFEDSDVFDLKRHVLRMWVCVPSARTLPSSWQEAYRATAPNTFRGGEREWIFPERYEAYYRRAAGDLGIGIAG